MRRIVLIDGHNLLFRMFYGIPAPIRNSKGIDIRGLIGFIGSLKKIVEEFKPFSVYVVFDSETSKNSNLDIDDNYKANRVDYSKVELDENPFTLLPMIKKSLDYLGIDYLEVQDYETDDFIASLVSKDNDENEYVIVSTDSDFLQLVDENIYLYVPRGKKSILYTREEVINKYKIDPTKYVLFKSLVGDKTDNIGGVKGIGKITAAKIFAYNSIGNFMESNPDSRFTCFLKENEYLIDRNQKLIRLNRDLDTSNVIFKELSKTIYESKTYEIIDAIKER